jgi:ankyrin repeat protein
VFIDGRRRLMKVAAGVAAGFVLAAYLAPAPVAQAQSVEEDFAIAVFNDRVAEVKRLLAAGASPDTTDKNGDPVIVIAVRAGSTASLDLLLGARANVNATTKFGDSALMVAALGGRL